MKSSDGVDCENIGAATGRGALGSVTVLSWADETDPSQLDRGFVAVSGLLAQRGRTLRQREFTTLAQLTALPDGIELVRYSGLDQLRETLRARFGGRHRQLKAHSALHTLRAVLLRHRSPYAVRTFRTVDRLLADNHCFTELQVLAGLPALPIPEPTRTALDHVLGGRGISPTTRLGLPPDAIRSHTRAAAMQAIRYWRDQLSDPLLDQPTARTYQAAIRSCEAIIAG